MGSQVYRPGALTCSVLLAVVFASPLYADTRVVRRGENLQTALNAARAGDVLLLEAGAEFVGNFVLPVKSGDSPIVVRSTAYNRTALLITIGAALVLLLVWARRFLQGRTPAERT